MDRLKFTIDSYKSIGSGKNKKYKISSFYYNSLAEPMDNYIIANSNYGFKSGNSYSCNIVKEENGFIYVNNIEQLDIDVNILKQCYKSLENYIYKEDIKLLLALDSIENIENEIRKYKFEEESFIFNEIVKSYNKNNLIKILNKFCIDNAELLVNTVMNKFAKIDLNKLFISKPYYFAYYFNLDIKHIKQLNNKGLKYSKVIIALKEHEKKGHVFQYTDNLLNDLNKEYYDILHLIEDINYLQDEGLIIINEDKVYLKYNYDVETNLINNLKQRILLKSNKLQEEAIHKIEQIIKNMTFTLNNEQIDAIYSSLKNNITIITGKAGCGKSTIISCILKSIKAIEPTATIEVVALTGKAVNEVNKKIKDVNKKNKDVNKKIKDKDIDISLIKAKTIHRLFSIRNNDYSYAKNIKDLDYLIIDEVSMLDNNLLNLIIKSIPYKCKLILVGDINQCEAIGIGTPIAYLIKSKAVKTVRLKVNERQGDTIIAKNADKIINSLGKDIKYKNNEFEFIEDASKLTKKVEILIKSGYEMKDITILAYKNSQIDKINKKICNIYLKSIRSNDFIIKDKVIQTINNNEKDIYNGEQGIITFIKRDGEDINVKVNFEHKVIEYNKYTLKQLKLAYGITIHKAQGSQSQVVIFLIDKSDKEHLNRNLIYTAITRAKKKCIIIGDKNTFNKCVCKLPEEKNSSILEELSKIA